MCEKIELAMNELDLQFTALDRPVMEKPVYQMQRR